MPSSKNIDWNIGFKHLNRSIQRLEGTVMESNGGARFLCFLTGVSIGALVGVLFAPHSGKRTRELIADQAGESRGHLFRKGREFREQAANYVERGKEVLADQRDHLVAAVAAGKQAYRAEAQSKGNP